MAASSLPYCDPATVPLAIEQQSRLFRIPRELRDRIYELIFQGENRTSNAEVAGPLLACRQFYVEARAIAFSNIDWRINWNQVIRKYFDGKGILPNGEPLLDVIYFTYGVDRLPDPEFSTRPPLDFTLSDIISRARLSDQQHTALRRMRRLTISEYWYDIFIQIHDIESGLLYHFLDGLGEFFLTDLQLDCLTFETFKPLDCLMYETMAHKVKSLFIRQWKPDLALLWERRLTKTVLIRDGADPAAEETTDYSDPPPGMDTEAWKHRIPYSNGYFILRHKIGMKVGNVWYVQESQSYDYLLQGEFDFDSAEHSRQWQWRFGKDEGSDPSNEDQFDYVEITHKAGR